MLTFGHTAGAQEISSIIKHHEKEDKSKIHNKENLFTADLPIFYRKVDKNPNQLDWTLYLHNIYNI